MFLARLREMFDTQNLRDKPLIKTKKEIWRKSLIDSAKVLPYNFEIF